MRRSGNRRNGFRNRDRFRPPWFVPVVGWSFAGGFAMPGGETNIVVNVG